jgi:hypothetical protein
MEPNKQIPKSEEIARRGIKTSHDLANQMSALMSDVLEGRVTPRIAKARCKAAEQLMREYESGRKGRK